jgi:hypothetical protein
VDVLTVIAAGSALAIVGAAGAAGVAVAAVRVIQRQLTLQLQAQIVEIARQENETRIEVHRLSRVVAAKPQGWHWSPARRGDVPFADTNLPIGDTDQRDSTEETDALSESIQLPHESSRQSTLAEVFARVDAHKGGQLTLEEATDLVRADRDAR